MFTIVLLIEALRGTYVNVENLYLDEFFFATRAIEALHDHHVFRANRKKLDLSLND